MANFNEISHVTIRHASEVVRWLEDFDHVFNILVARDIDLL